MNKIERKLVDLCSNIIDELDGFKSENAYTYCKILQGLVDDIETRNQIVIQRREVKNLNTGEKWREAHIFDDYGNMGSVPMDALPIDNLALFSKIVKEQIDHDYTGIDDILQCLYETESGIAIAGEYFDYKSIETALEYYMES